MDEIQSGAKAYQGAYKAAVELVCKAVELTTRASGESRSFGDVMLFEIAREIKMNPGGRASQYLDHFLFGGGDDMTFSAGLLLNEDAGVRRRVSDWIVDKLRSNPSLKTKRISGGDYLIPIRQKDYAVSDWKNALGSYSLEWELVQLSSDKKRMFARVWGANEYKWHPAADRVTQCIHQAGDRLTRSKQVKAKNFWMMATPVTIAVSTGKPVTP